MAALSDTHTTAGVARFDVGSGRSTGEIRKLTSLLEVSQALANATNFKASLHRVLEILEKSHDAVRSAVAIESGEQVPLEVVASMGAGRDQAWQTAASTGALARQVFSTGRPVVVPRVSREPALGERRHGDDERTFVCAPLLLNRRATGVLCLELRFKAERDYERTGKFFGVIASMIAHAIKVQRLLEADRERLVQENVRLQGELRERYDFSHILGTSRAMHSVCEQMMQVARTNTTVLIRGESGTGKELIAQAIHYNSQRSSKPFVKVSCAALPDTLIESELFGYEKGAFTGAAARKQGRFERADGGTLFLDEIGDINPSIQVKLLRVLQEREFERLGGVEPVKVNVRLIAATNKHLEDAIAAGTFREDLLYRLNVFMIFVPPLRERKTDVLLLADHFLERLAADHRKRIRRISTPAIDMLMAYHWPGNVRELQNVMERAVLVCDGDVVHAHHLPPTLQMADTSDASATQSLAASLAAFEKDVIQDALKMARGNRAKAARLLHATPRMVNYKIRKYRIDWRRFQ
ncbi:MAG TPA: sigma 54-interacting transcriptional regulator [Vicinamibacterales bacterium]|nr:sigma 54-interacting transcriptional regulator [Vicinamibacterales bacterium]